MTYEIRIDARPEQEAAVVHDLVALDGIASFLGEAFGEVSGALARQGLFPAGPPFARYQVVESGFDVEAGFACSGRARAEGRVEPVVLPGGEIAETVHVGAYDEVSAAYTAVMHWLTDNGRVPVGDPWELYLDDPSVPEPRTVVCVPCAPRTA
jgi:effector-binding domain-containing protein